VLLIVCQFSKLNTATAIPLTRDVVLIAKAPQVQAVPNQTYISSGCRLPPCDNEVFSGDYLQWPTFGDLCTAAYINNPWLTPIVKLFHLNAKTSGQALTIFSNSPFNNEGFRSAWANLTERFENKRLLVNRQLEKLFNVP